MYSCRKKADACGEVVVLGMQYFYMTAMWEIHEQLLKKILIAKGWTHSQSNKGITFPIDLRYCRCVVNKPQPFQKRKVLQFPRKTKFQKNLLLLLFFASLQKTKKPKKFQKPKKVTACSVSRLKAVLCALTYIFVIACAVLCSFIKNKN